MSSNSKIKLNIDLQVLARSKGQADQGALMVEASAFHKASATGDRDACIDWLAEVTAALPSSCGFNKNRRMSCSKILQGDLV